MEICPKKNPVLTQRDNLKLCKLVENKLFPLNKTRNYTLRDPVRKALIANSKKKL